MGKNKSTEVKRNLSPQFKKGKIKITVPLDDEATEYKDIYLTPKQKQFCETYLGPRETFGNGVQSYLVAVMGIDPEKATASDKNTAGVNAHKLLTKEDICLYLNSINNGRGLSRQNVDKAHAFCLNQFGNLTVKIAAVKEANKLLGRTDDKINIDKALIVTGFNFEEIKPKESTD